MTEEKPVQENETKEKARPERRRGSRTVLLPIVLIAAGVLFLLDNLGIIGDLNWAAALQYWPLALIFLGLNVLVVQARPPWGTFLSALVALMAVGVFGYLLIAGSPDHSLRALGLPMAHEVEDVPFAVPLDVESAEITLELSNYITEIAARDDNSLVSGTIRTRTGLNLERHDENGRAEVRIGERGGGFSPNPADWVQEGHTWEFFLNPAVPIDLTIDAGNGAVEAELGELTLSNLVIDAANSHVTARLPDGDYDVRLDGGNGSMDLRLPAAGRREVIVDGGNGSIGVVLPDGVAARVVYDTGNGSVGVDDRFTRVEGDDDEGVYQTDDYDTAADRVLFIVDTGNGEFRVTGDE